MTSVDRRFVLLAVGLVAAMAFVIPVMGADPSPSASPPAEVESDEPDATESAAEKAEEKANKAPEIALTLAGTVVKTTDGKGRPTFTLTVGGVTWELSAGPKWYWGDKSPLSAFVGKTVRVAGTHHEGDTELDVETVDGMAIRAAGKPPWAGGPKVVGERHPGWKAWKADKDKARNKPAKIKDTTTPG